MYGFVVVELLLMLLLRLKVSQTRVDVGSWRCDGMLVAVNEGVQTLHQGLMTLLW